MPRPSAASCTSAQRSAAASDRRKPPWNSTATSARSVAPRSAAAASDSMPRPVRLGMLAVAMIAATLSAVSGSAWPRPRPAAWRVRALQNAADAIMAGRIIGAGVNVAGADRGPAFAVVLCTVSRPALDTDRSQTDGKTLSTCPSPVIHSLPPRARHRTRIPPRRSSVPQEFREYRPAGSCTAMGCESGSEESPVPATGCPVSESLRYAIGRYAYRYRPPQHNVSCNQLRSWGHTSGLVRLRLRCRRPPGICAQPSRRNPLRLAR